MLRGATYLRRLFLLLILFFVTAISSAEEKRYVVPLEDSPAYGAQDAPVTIVEFLDYQ